MICMLAPNATVERRCKLVLLVQVHAWSKAILIKSDFTFTGW